MSYSLPQIITAWPEDRLALDDGLERESYGDLRTATERISTWCTYRYGIDQCVVIKARSSSAFLKAWLGIVHSGNTVVPVDPDLPKATLDLITQKAGASSVLEPDHIVHEANALAPAARCLQNSRDSAMIMFTSGTTGHPKGVVMTNSNLRHSWKSISEYLGLTSSSSTICALPLHYSYGLLSQVLCILSVGGYVRLVDGMHNPLRFERTVQKEEIAYFCGVPSSFAILARFHRLRPLSMPSIQVVCSAGAAFDMSLYPAIKEIFPNAVIFNNYGMTEACPRISYVSDRDPMFHKGSCGIPMPGVDLVTLDPHSNEILPQGQEGVLGIRGPNIMNGYLEDEERNQRIFQRDGYFVTGDVGKLVEGYLFLQGRMDEIFNVGGEKVAPLEIESVLKEIPEVTAALVRGIYDPDRGQVPVAFLILSGEIEKKALDIYLRSRLTSKKIPFVYYEASKLPMTTNGKLKRSEIFPGSPSVLRSIK